MTLETWPAGVNDEFLLDSVSEEEPDAVERTQVDEGPELTRLKDAKPPRRISGEILMVSSEYETFRSWFVNSIARGAVRFSWHLPGEDTLYPALMMPPKRRSVNTVDGGPLWRVSLTVDFYVDEA